MIAPALYNFEFLLFYFESFPRSPMKRFFQFSSLGFTIAICLFSLPSLAQDKEKVDLETMARIRYEGFHNSKVMDFAQGLMDSIGERLTGSPNMKRANEWTRDQFTAMGRSNTSTCALPRPISLPCSSMPRRGLPAPTA